MRSLPLLLVSLSSCYSEDWLITDSRIQRASSFWAHVKNFQGQHLSSVENYPLNPGGRTQLNVSGPLPVIELKDLEVTAWTDAAGPRDCNMNCAPLPGDQVIVLTKRNWPFVYDIHFTDGQ